MIVGLLLQGELMQSIVILGRRWFRKSAGNTYSSATILIDGAVAHVCPMQGGYGDYYLQMAFEWLDAQPGLLAPPREQHRNGSSESPWQWAQRAGVTLHYSATDVAREQDL